MPEISELAGTLFLMSLGTGGILFGAWKKDRFGKGR